MGPLTDNLAVISSFNPFNANTSNNDGNPSEWKFIDEKIVGNFVMWLWPPFSHSNVAIDFLLILGKNQFGSNLMVIKRDFAEVVVASVGSERTSIYPSISSRRDGK